MESDDEERPSIPKQADRPSMSRRLDRRDFVASAAVGAGMLWTGVVRAADKRSPNDKLNLAFVATQGQAGFSIDGCKEENIVALCDVDSKNLGSRAAALPKARQYRDYRQMLEKEEKNVDAVVVATPDHHHALATAMALRMGK